MSSARLVRLLAAAAVFVPLMLLADSPYPARQLVVAGATVLFLILVTRETAIAPVQIVLAIVIATAGEVVLSLVWKLYTYKHALIPFYVPPGHGIFYALAAASANQPSLQRHQRSIVRAVLIFGTTYALLALALVGDSWGLLWWIGAAVLISRSRSPLLLSACVIFTILLEWAGTAIGNWRWAAVVPVVGLRSGNPPSGVGILYCLLDLFTVSLCSRVAGWKWPGRRLLEEVSDVAPG